MSTTVVWLNNLYVQAFTQGIAYGIYVILGSLSVFILVRQGLRESTSRTVLTAIFVIMFIASTGAITATILLDLLQINSLDDDPESYPLRAVERWYSAGTVFVRINYVLSDAVVVWRAFILFNHRSVFRIILVLCWLGSFTTATAECVLTISAGPGGNEYTPDLFLILLLPLFITNIVATLCIAYRTWIFLHLDKRSTSISESSRGRHVKQVLFFLVESGFLYCIIWSLAIISSQNGVSHLSKNVFAGLMPHISAIYPTLIILLMSFQNNFGIPSDETIRSRSVEFSEHVDSQVDPILPVVRPGAIKSTL